jgi:hypothetical protein
MKHHSPTVFSVLSILTIVTVIGLMLATGNVTSRAADPTPGSKLSTPQEGAGGPAATRQAPDVSFESKNAGAPPTVDDLYEKYPMLEAYLEKLDSIEDLQKDLDFKELYNVLALIYKDFGAAGVGLFLEESYMDYDLGVPLPYFDLIEVYEEGGMDKVIAQAKAWKFINDKDEVIGYLAIDPEEKLDAVKSELTKLGVSSYEFDDEEWILEIGIPVKMIRDLKTPDVVLKFMSAIGYIDGVYEFFAPEPELAKS